MSDVSGDEDEGSLADEMSDVSDDEDERSLTDADFLKDDLLIHISGIRFAGSFATFGIVDDFVHPGISVDPLEVLRLPLSEEDARRLTHSTYKAPFSKGDQASVDKSVRKTCQINAEKVQFNNKAWKTCLDRIVEKVAGELGIAGGSSNIRVKLHKMLLYEKGILFKEHKNTEKVPGIFGTLDICLPSKHTGGAVCLQHGRKRLRYETSEPSAFNASYIAWYGDVTHETEPIESGYKWILTYNLINESDNSHPTASTLDARVSDFTKILTQWQNLENSPQFLAYALAHQYTNAGLKLCHLKGDDYFRALHVVESCAKHGEFSALLANVMVKVTDLNHDGETERYIRTHLTQIIDIDGFDLSKSNCPSIPHSTILKDLPYDEDDLEVQYECEFCGNKQSVRESVIIILPKHHITSFLLGNRFSELDFRNLYNRLKVRAETKDNNLPMREYLLQIHQASLSGKYQRNNEADLYSGIAAEAAMLLHDASLFEKSVKHAIEGFGKTTFSKLGEMISFEHPVVSETDIIEALTKSGKLSKTYDNLNSFHDGFSRGNPDRNSPPHVEQSTAWLDSVMFTSLQEIERVCAEDAKFLVRIILDRDNDPFRQFVLYQGVTKCVDRFLHNGTLPIALAVELHFHLEGQGRPHKYLESLLQRVMKSTILHFDFQQYAACIRSYNSGSNSRGQGKSEIGVPRSEPIKTIYQFACEHDQCSSSQLLQKIKAQASELHYVGSTDAIIPLLGEMIPIMDSASSEVREFVLSLVTSYISEYVGQKPERRNSRWFEMARRTWKQSVSDVRETLLRLPHPKLQHYLTADEYDKIMEFPMLRAGNDSASSSDSEDTNESEQSLPQAESSVPAKRAFEEET